MFCLALWQLCIVPLYRSSLEHILSRLLPGLPRPFPSTKSFSSSVCSLQKNLGCGCYRTSIYDPLICLVEFDMTSSRKLISLLTLTQGSEPTIRDGGIRRTYFFSSAVVRLGIYRSVLEFKREFSSLHAKQRWAFCCILLFEICMLSE